MHTIEYTPEMHQTLLKWYNNECDQDMGYRSELYRTLGITIDYVANEIIFESESDFIMAVLKYS